MCFGALFHAMRALWTNFVRDRAIEAVALCASGLTVVPFDGAQFASIRNRKKHRRHHVFMISKPQHGLRRCGESPLSDVAAS
jgi:hypothetical protein